MSVNSAPTFQFRQVVKVALGDVPEFAISQEDRECLKELHLEEERLKNAFGKNYIIEEGNPIINEFVACTFKKTSYMTKDGKLNLTQLENWLKSDFFELLNRNDIENQDQAATEIVLNCKEVDGADIGDTAVKAYNCMIETLLNYPST